MNLQAKIKPCLVMCLSGLSFLISASARVQAMDPVSLWARGDSCYVCMGTPMPIWPELPQDALAMGKFLGMTIELPQGFEIVAYGESTEFAMQPVPLIVPFAIDSLVVGDKVVYDVKLPIPPTSGHVRAALLVSSGDAAVGSYSMTIGLRTLDGVTVWPDNAATIHVLDALGQVRPDRVQVSVFDYADYTNESYKSGMTEILRKSGVNFIHNMNYYDSTDTIAQQLRPEGVKAGWIWWWSKHAQAITAQYPEARCLDVWGARDINSLCYTWCIANRQLATELLTAYIAQENNPQKYDCLFNDNEEKAYVDGQVYGDLYTPMTLEEFRRQAGIDAGVTLTPAVIAANYADEWVDFRCWQCSEMSKILADAVKAYDSDMLYSIYSGYKYTGSYAGHSKAHYSVDWDLMSENPNMDFGCAGYYGTAYIGSTAAALGPIPFMPGEMFVEHFLTQPTMPSRDEFFFRLTRSMLLGGGKGGVGVWYAQVLDGAAYSAISKTAFLAAKIEDYFFDGVRCDDELSLSTNLYAGDVYAYRIGSDRRMVVVLNSEYAAKTVRLTWDQLGDGAQTIELQSGQEMSDPRIIQATMGPRSVWAFETRLTNGPLECGDPGTVYLAGDANEDCRVDMVDLAAVAGNWLMCSDPDNSQCQ